MAGEKWRQERATFKIEMNLTVVPPIVFPLAHPHRPSGPSARRPARARRRRLRPLGGPGQIRRLPKVVRLLRRRRVRLQQRWIQAGRLQPHLPWRSGLLLRGLPLRRAQARKGPAEGNAALGLLVLHGGKVSEPFTVDQLHFSILDKRASTSLPRSCSVAHPSREEKRISEEREREGKESAAQHKARE